MCGIAGILLSPRSSDPERLSAVQGMTDALAHRGPDGAGMWVDKEAGIALGHRRLSIIDLSEAGRQPMASQNNRMVITYNGEIYNFQELRTDLQERGHRFRGTSDTEVMLEAMQDFGFERTLPSLAGMFAIAAWDREERILHLARDRIGKKPLYVTLVRGALLFASEMKALQAFPEFSPEIDPDAATAMLNYGWVPDHLCIWKNVFKLQPGTSLSIKRSELDHVNAAELKQRMKPWWSLAEIAKDGQDHPLLGDDDEVEEQLDALLRTAVRQRMVADVPLGAFLSGGVDSSTVVALMQAQSNRPVKTFTIGFGEAGYDESADAARIAAHLGTDHTELRVGPRETLNVIPEIGRVWDEPFADESQIPTLIVSRLARQHVTVILSGDGGDECFGGYTRHLAAERLSRAMSVPRGVRHASAAAFTFLKPNTISTLGRMLPLPRELERALANPAVRKLVKSLDAVDEREVYDKLVSNGGNGAGSWQEQQEPKLTDAAARMIYRDMVGYLPGDILVKVDRASMAVGLEARAPLLDHRVIEFSWRLPTSMKIKGWQGKRALRRILNRYVPADLYDRPKQGFNVPIGTWLRGPLRDWAENLLSAQKLQQREFNDRLGTEKLWQEHLSGRVDHSRQLWSVLMFQSWLHESQQRGVLSPSSEPEKALEGSVP